MGALYSKKRDRIIVAVNSCVRKHDSNFGIKIPSTVEEAKAIDRENVNIL